MVIPFLSRFQLSVTSLYPQKLYFLYFLIGCVDYEMPFRANKKKIPTERGEI